MAYVVRSKGGGSVLVDSLLIFALIAFGSFVFGPCLIMLSSFANILTGYREQIASLELFF